MGWVVLGWFWGGTWGGWFWGDTWGGWFWGDTWGGWFWGDTWGGWFCDGTWDGSYHWQQKMCFVITKVILVAAPTNDTFCGGTWMVGSVVVHGTWDGWFSGGTWDFWFCAGTWDMGWMVLWWYMGHGMDGSVVVHGT